MLGIRHAHQAASENDLYTFLTAILVLGILLGMPNAPHWLYMVFFLLTGRFTLGFLARRKTKIHEVKMAAVKAAQTPASTTMMALVFLADQGFASSQSFARAIQAAFPGSTFEVTPANKADPLFLFRYEDVFCAIMSIGAPAPLNEKDPLFANAWFWPNARKEISQHRAHHIVSTGGGRDAKHRALIIQRLLSVILSLSPSAIGVHEAAAETLLPTKMVLRVLQPPDQVALMLFVSYRFAREAEHAFPNPGIFVSTKGLSQFGVREIEARGYTGSIQDLFAFTMSFATDLLDHPESYKDGDTAGLNETQKIPIRIVKSLIRDEDVYCLYFQ